MFRADESDAHAYVHLSLCLSAFISVFVSVHGRVSYMQRLVYMCVWPCLRVPIHVLLNSCS